MWFCVLNFSIVSPVVLFLVTELTDSATTKVQYYCYKHNVFNLFSDVVKLSLGTCQCLA